MTQLCPAVRAVLSLLLLSPEKTEGNGDISSSQRPRWKETGMTIQVGLSPFPPLYLIQLVCFLIFFSFFLAYRQEL